MTIRLNFSNNSVKNTTIDSDSPPIHYEVDKADGVVTVKQLNSADNAAHVVGQFELGLFKKDRVRIAGGSEGWKELGDVLHKEDGLFNKARTFTGDNGRAYRWTTSGGNLVMCEDSDTGKEPALVTYHRHRFGKETSYLEIADESVMNSLDSAIVTFLIMERKRRDRQKRRHTAGGAGGGGGT